MNLNTRLDQFYTNSDIAKFCVENFTQQFGSLEKFDTILEPSAGSGSFLKHLPSNVIAIDLEPKANNVQLADFLSWNFSNLPGSILVIGNPPFGKNSSLAVKFFNRAAKFADTIAFVVPRTFRKTSLIKRLDKRFHMKFEFILPANSFHLPNGQVKDVPCVFQIWTKMDIERKNEIEKLKCEWIWCDSNSADYAIRRVGVNAGMLFSPSGKSIASHFFVKSVPDHFEDKMKKLWNEQWKCNYESCKFDTAGNPSLTKNEIISCFNLLNVNTGQ